MTGKRSKTSPDGKLIWKQCDYAARHRVASAVQKGEQVFDEREAVLAVHLSTKWQRELRRLPATVPLMFVAAFLLYRHNQQPIGRSLAVAGIAAALMAVVVGIVLAVHMPRFKRAERLNRIVAGSEDAS